MNIKVNQTVKLYYPSSKTGQPELRVGRVEKVTKNYLIVETENKGFRTFKFDRIIGPIKIVE